ncbi:uncharacterized protein LOC119299348 isoform X2 [Triticum dicoccoides]|uniref:uncharacterized protein LOC119299348 isoform X2 n=1 Tax=Triticum dicoccoides TaxID=85692 RepID=UPI00188EE96E|nr:uncharacterized protein LOC119299348 isoform X2 [Triticum dicoccoides]
MPRRGAPCVWETSRSPIFRSDQRGRNCWRTTKSKRLTVCNGSTLKTLGTFTSSEDSRGAIATAPTSPIVYLAGLTAAFVILNICATLLDTADSGPTLLDAANSGHICILKKIRTPGKHEAQAITSDIESRAYRNKLIKSFSTDLAAAPNKASFLQNLCQELQFDPELASKMHKDTKLTLVFCITSLILQHSSMLAQNLILLLLARCVPY